MLEEYGTTIKHIKGPGNDAAYSLIGLPSIKFDVTERNVTRETLSETYFVDKFFSHVLTNIPKVRLIPKKGQRTLS